ncbi:MAG: hypothetical protein WCL29_04970, partial [Pseudomonadota bacterium]
FMMCTKLIRKTLTLVVLVAVAGSAYAVDYTLNVPVSVKDHNPTSPLAITCYLKTSSTDTAAGQWNSHGEFPRGTVARAEKPLPTPNGVYSGTVALVFALTDQQVGYAETYRCEFTAGRGIHLGNVSKPNSNSVMFVEGKVQ